MLNKLKLVGRGAAPFAQHAKFTKRKSDQEGWTAGVFLKARANGDRIWLQRIMINGKRREIELGSFLVLTLSEARAAAQENKQTIAEGGDIFARLRRQHQQDIRDRIRRLSAKLNDRTPLPAPQSIAQELQPFSHSLSLEEPSSSAAETSPDVVLIAKVRALGPHIDAALSVIMEAVSTDDDPAYVSQDMLALSEACGAEMLDRACKIVLEKGDCTLWSIVAILDEEPAAPAPSQDENATSIAHGNIRGPQHFH